MDAFSLTKVEAQSDHCLIMFGPTWMFGASRTTFHESVE